ncbi:hypothetical protein ABZZ79_21360 [Streptomyces sp. NPDC006458]|uniref:hypothetical protein n=1 Tax=Streptomyces sp. NPDC006458 TaxID=3154302 RepID=UPI0033A51D03
MSRNALAALCLAATTAVVLTGCSGGDSDKADSSNKAGTPSASSASPAAETKEPFAGLSAGEIADKAFEATTGARSVRVKGDMQDDATGGPLTIDLALDKRGDCAGTLSADGGKTDLIKTGDTVYMRYDEAFLRAQMKGEPEEDVDAAVDMLAGTWTTSAEDSEASEIGDLCDLDTLLGEDADTAGGTSSATRGGTTTVGGSPALALQEKDGKESATLYVATEGEPYVLRLDNQSADDAGSLLFSDYDKPVAAQKPEGEILDLDNLG